MTMANTNPNPTSNIKTARRLIRREKGADYLAECVADNGQVYPRAFPGYIFVREVGGTVPGETYMVRSHRNFLPAYGTRVWVTYVDRYDDWVIDENDPDSLSLQGVNPSMANPSNPWRHQVLLSSMGPLNTFAVSGGATSTTEVAVDNFIYQDYLGATKAFKLGASSRPDIADYQPGAGLKRLAHLWLQHDNTIAVTQSTAIAQGFDFSVATHLAEVMDARPDQLAIPVGAWVASNGDTATDPSDFYVDTRPWLNTPQYAGFPNPVARNYIVPAGVTETVAGNITVTADLTVQGELVVDGRPTLAHVWRDHEPASATVTTGTLLSGTVASVKTMYDGSALHVDEVTGTPGFNIQFGFKDVSTTQPPNFIIARWKYDGSTTHYVTIDMYNYSTTAWDQVRVFKTSEGYYSSMTMYMPNANAGNYVDATGNALCRFYHNTAGNASHDILIDYVGLTYGPHY